MFRFVHCADLHLGSPFSSWRGVRPELARELALAPFAAFDKLADAAVENGALFMVLAGDVFDTAAPSLYAETRFAATLKRLDAAGIRVFWATGNHDWRVDPGDLPANAVRFPAERAAVFDVESGGRVVARVAGISHGAAAVRDDLAPQLDAALAGKEGFRIAVLHANVDGDPGHEPYAPAPLAELRTGHADYWALGHIHKRRVLCERPFVVYSGSAQGRSVGEPGARGGVLVEVDDAGRAAVRMLDAELFRFGTLVLDDLKAADSAGALREAFVAKLPAAGGRMLLRVVLAGGCPLNAQLRAAGEGELEEIFSAALRRALPGAELESVIVRTTAVPDAARREGLAAEVAAVRSAVDPAAPLREMQLSPEELAAFADGELDEIAHEAEELLLDYLSGDLRCGK